MLEQEFILDENQKELLLKGSKYQVMMEWEKPYMEAIIDEIKPTGDVLEIGFGCGYSATQIQHYNPKSHTIIECDTTVIQRCKNWSEKYKNINIIHNTWQKALSSVGEFDFIFFDDYPLETFEEVTKENLLQFRADQERLYMFIDICLDWHMKPESILSCYLNSSESKFNNSRWKDLIIENPRILYKEKIIDIEIPKNCNYFKGNNKVVIPIIKKVG